MTSKGDNGTEPPGGTLGTFGGVFTPSILTILGLVLFLRVAYVVGAVGLLQALVILVLATSVSVLTSISLAVVATNMKVRGGGEYFLISRTLGIEFGGAVGVVLYLAISVSIAFYAIGFAEALASAFGDEGRLMVSLLALGLVVLLAGIGYIGADLATRLQYLVMVLLVVALVSFVIGAATEFDTTTFGDNVGRQDSGIGFWEAFAIFFPAVTGFSQGVAMSGDLRTPSRSITRGTFTAVAVSTAVYLTAIVLLAGARSAERLVADTTTVMGDLSIIEATMIVGVLAATVSSALASTLGSPRVLQRLGEDRVLPRLELFAEGAGPANNPRRALAVSVVIAIATVAAGDLNAIAPVISMFFLATYGLINYATYFEIRAGSTSFRPRFRWYDKRASLVGTIACAGAIVAINPLAGALAAVVFIALYNYLSYRTVPERWTDSAGAHHYTRVRAHLESLHDEPVDERDWRPCILAFVPRDPANRFRMLTLASWLEGDSGFLTAVRILKGKGAVLRRQAAGVEADLAGELDREVPGAYARAVLTADVESGVQALVQSHGLGDIRANMTLFGVRDLQGSEEDRITYGTMLQNCVRFGTNVAVINVRDDAWRRFEETPERERSIGLWWSDDKAGQLITLLGWLCQRHPEWDEATIVVFAPKNSHEGDEAARIEQVLHDARIEAAVVEVEPTPAAFANALSGVTLAFAPLRVRKGAALGPFDTSLGMLVEGLPLAVMILVTESVELDADADESQIAAFAKATDQAEAARQWAAELDAAAARLLVAAERARIEAEEAAAESDPDEERVEALRQRSTEAEKAATTAYRTYVDARARSAEMDERANQLNPAASSRSPDPDIWRSSSERSTS